MKWICLLFILVSFNLVYADEMALFNKDEVKKYINEANESDLDEDHVETIDNYINSKLSEENLVDPQQDDFLEEEVKKIREIKLLSLDVEKKGLEYKQQVINSRINKLNGLNDSLLNAPVYANRDESSIRVLATVVSDTSKYGIILINGVKQKVIENQQIDDIQVLQINKRAIKFKFSNGIEGEVLVS